MSLRTLVYLAWGAAIFGFRPAGANWLGAVIVLGMSILAFIGLGILSAAYLLLFKQGNPGKWMLMAVSGVLGGQCIPSRFCRMASSDCASSTDYLFAGRFARRVAGRRGFCDAMARDSKTFDFRRSVITNFVLRFRMGAPTHKNQRNAFSLLIATK